MRFCELDFTLNAGLFRSLLEEWRSLPEAGKQKYIQQSEKLKGEYIEATAQWNEKMAGSGKAEELQKANERLKTVKSKKKAEAAEAAEAAEPGSKASEKKPKAAKAAKSSEKAKSPAKDKKKA